MAREQFDLIVFDWDGTLMDSTAHITRSIQAACSDLGLPVPGDEAASYVIGLGLREALQIAAPTLDPADYPRLVERYRIHYLVKEQTTELFAGVREMLAELREVGYLLAVATGKSRVGLNRALDEARLTSLFDGTRCADETFSKPLRISNRWGSHIETSSPTTSASRRDPAIGSDISCCSTSRCHARRPATCEPVRPAISTPSFPSAAPGIFMRIAGRRA